MTDFPATKSQGKRWHWAARIGLLLILALSAFIQFTVSARSETLAPLRADARTYFSYAYNLKHFGTYSRQASPWDKTEAPAPVIPDAVSTPGYPLFLLAIPGLEPTEAYLHRVSFVQAGLGVISVWLVYLISRSFLGRGRSLAAAFLTAVTPHLATVNTYVLTESLFIFLLMLSVLATIRAFQSKRAWIWCIAGVIWGTCSLVRPTTLYLIPVLAAGSLLLPSLRQFRRHAAFLFIGLAVTQIPWIVRNHVSPLDTSQPNLIVNFLHHGSYPGFMYNNQPASYGFPYAYDPDNAAHSKNVRAALDNIFTKFREQPLTYANWYLFGKPGKFFSWGIINGFGDLYMYPPIRSPYLEDIRFAVMRMVSIYTHWPLMLLGLAGSFLVWLRPQALGIRSNGVVASRLVSATVLYAIAFHMVGAPFPRYGIPFRPFMFILAVMMLSAPFLARKHREGQS